MEFALLLRFDDLKRLKVIKNKKGLVDIKCIVYIIDVPPIV